MKMSSIGYLGHFPCVLITPLFWQESAMSLVGSFHFFALITCSTRLGRKQKAFGFLSLQAGPQQMCL